VNPGLTDEATIFSDHAKQTNASCPQLSHWLQLFAIDALILSICKLHEKPSSRNPNYGIPAAIELLKKNIADLSVLDQNHLKVERFIQNRIDPGFNIANMTNMTSDRISESEIDRMTSSMPKNIVDWFDEHCPQLPPRRNGKYDLGGTDTEASPKDFVPNKSRIWRRMQEMLKLLEQQR
jgi:hypothetical protein